MTIVQVAHITDLHGPVQDIDRFFSDKKDVDIYKIYHPLEKGDNIYSLFYNGCSVLDKKKASSRILVAYFLSFFQTLRWLGSIKKPINIAIGMNPFDTLPLILFKKRFNIKEIVFFNTDFSRKRFDNKILNNIYIIIDKFVAKKADKICCNTQRTIMARLKDGVHREKIILIPNGIFLDDIGVMNIESKKFEKKIIFIGYVSMERGLQNIIEKLPGHNIRLEIMGIGQYTDYLKKLVNNLGVGDKVSFLGYKKHQEVIEYLKNFSGFGISSYSAITDLLAMDWMKYCDPVKVKEYLACLIPPIVFDVPEIAATVKEKNLGYVYNNDTIEDMLAWVESINDSSYKEMLENILEIREEFDLNLIYNKIL